MMQPCQLAAGDALILCSGRCRVKCTQDFPLCPCRCAPTISAALRQPWHAVSWASSTALAPTCFLLMGPSLVQAGWVGGGAGPPCREPPGRCVPLCLQASLRTNWLVFLCRSRPLAPPEGLLPEGRCFGPIPKQAPALSCWMMSDAGAPRHPSPTAPTVAGACTTGKRGCTHHC